MSAWSACGQPRCVADALLPLDVARHVGPALQPEPLRLHRRPDVDERVADDEHVLPERRARDLVGDPALLRARHEVVDQHPDPALRAGPEVAQVARPGRRRRRGTRRPRPRSAGRRPRPSRPARRRAGPRRRSGSAGPPGPARRGRRPSRTPYGSASAGACARDRGGEDHRPALEQEARAEREGTPPGAAVLERDRVQVAVDGDDLAAPVVVTSSTTAPSSAGASTARPRFGARQSVARTSVP